MLGRSVSLLGRMRWREKRKVRKWLSEDVGESTGMGMVEGGKGCIGYCIRNRNRVSCYEAAFAVGGMGSRSIGFC